MKIRDVMNHTVQVISGGDTIRRAADTMRTHNVGALPVREGAMLNGMLTDRDIAVRAVAGGYDPDNTLVRDIMTTRVFACFDDQELEEVAGLMKDRRIRRVIVLNEYEQPVGIVSIDDIAAHAGVGLSVRALKEIVEPVHS